MTVGSPTPAVTCVLIFLDGARFIDEAIRSVVAQSDDVDWELVLVDDGSTDESTVIARRWAAADPRIRYLEHEGHANLGMSASRNAGVAAARGDPIGFLDCDDVWLPTALSRGLRVFALHPDADVVISGTWRWYGWTGDPADRARDQQMTLPEAVPHTLIEPPALFAGMFAIPGVARIPAMCSLLITRRGWVRIGGLDYAFRGLYEDQVFYAKIALHLRAVIDPRPMALYRQHEASACEVAIADGEWHRIGPSEPERRYFEWMRTYAMKQAAGDAAVLDVAARNLDHAAREAHVTPTEPPPSLRSHVPEPIRGVVRAVRNRLREPVCGVVQAIRDRLHEPERPITVVGRWSEQFLGPIAGLSDDTTLVVEAAADGDPWVVAPPAEAFAGRAVRRRWSEAATAATTYDRVVVPLAVGASVATSMLFAGIDRRLAPQGLAAVLVPGPALEPGRPDAPTLVGLIGAIFRHRRIDVESFGNATTAASPHVAAAQVGPEVDRHDPAVPVVFGITIGSRGDDP